MDCLLFDFRVEISARGLIAVKMLYFRCQSYRIWSICYSQDYFDSMSSPPSVFDHFIVYAKRFDGTEIMQQSQKAGRFLLSVEFNRASSKPKSSKIIIEVNLFPILVMEIRPLSDLMSKRCGKSMNKACLELGKSMSKDLLNLLEYSEISVGAFDDMELRGYVICLPPATEYGSLNYGWFNSNMEDFLYVDRIAVAQIHRDKGIGSMLYSHHYRVLE